MEIQDILARCDHTLLRQDCTSGEIKVICDDAIKYRCASVCIPPVHVAGARRYCGDRMKICTVIGFPNGYSTTAVKVFEARDAIAHGADEIDMVADICMIKEKRFDKLSEEIAAVKEACGDKILKVIIETCLLSDEEKAEMCAVVGASGADFIKTSTGFSEGGATLYDIELMRKHSPASLRIKAAGGISSFEDAEAFVNAGADRLGTSRLVKLAKELEQSERAE